MKKFISILLSLAMLPITACSAEESKITYKSFFEKDKIIEIQIDIDENDLQDMYDYPTNEEYHAADITINGVKAENAGIRTKGNMTLTSTARSDSDRYSFRIKFDKYVKGQTLLGLDELCLNSGYSDPSYMREYLHYEILREMGMKTADTAFCNVYINGELSGFYLAAEGLDDTFLEENFGKDYKNGNFYKMDEGSSLAYKEDENYTYADLKVGKDTDLTSFKEFIKKLNNAPDGKKGDIESFLDVDSALIYIASNTVLCNYDSYNGNMHHNFYLYENEDGIFTVVPWDFNMSFGGFGGANSNIGIDTPFISGSLETLPLIGKLLSVSEYKEKYYDYIKQIVKILENFEDRVAELKAIITPYVKNDPTSFYTFEDFDKATSKQEKSEEETKPDTEKAPEDISDADPKERMEHKSGMFGGNSSVINCVLDRVSNIKAQFDGKADKVTEVKDGFGKKDFNGEGRPQPLEGFDPDGMSPPFGDFDPSNMTPPEGFDPTDRPPNGERPEKGFGGKFEGGMFGQQTGSSVIRVHTYGHIIKFDTDPVIENDTTLVGFRAILEALGAEVKWNEESRTVTAVKENTTIVLTIDSNTALVNGETKSLLAAPRIIGSSTMVPVRFISEQLGMKVGWDEKTRLITITSK